MTKSISAELLHDFEPCRRHGFWSRDWVPQKIHPTRILYEGIARALVERERTDYGELAGEHVMYLCGERGLDTRYTHHKYDIGLHHASLADIITTYLVREVGALWRVPAPVMIGNVQWESGCLLGPSGTLARVVLCDYWTDERKSFESHCWHTLGEVAAYKMPMDIWVICLGQSRFGKRHSHWSKGLLHPRNQQLRFTKRNDKRIPFTESWRQVYREDYSQISREQWLKAMEDDLVLGDLAYLAQVTVPESSKIGRLQEIIERKAIELGALKVLPDPSYSGCDGIKPCPFQVCCFGSKESTPEEEGFLRRLTLLL